MNAAALLLLTTALGAQTPDQLLLKDYHPRSIYQVPITRVERAKFPVVDMHSHNYAETDAEVAAWVAAMDRCNIAKTVVLFTAAGPAFDEGSKRYRKYPDRFELWCGLDFTGFDKPGFAAATVAELRRCKAAGAKGVGEVTDKGGGLNGNTGGMHLDDPRMDPILEALADLGLPINVHVGEDQWMYEPADNHNDGLMNAYTWKIADSPAILRHDQVLATLDRAVKRHPRTLFIACHLANCCHDLSLLGAMLDKYPNLWADIGARYAETAPIPRAAAKFIGKYQDRLLYGTDMGMDAAMYQVTFRILETEDEHFYETDQFGYHWPLYGFGLDAGILRKLYADNAVEVMKRAARR
jgi:uncharacterized protein